MTVEEEATQLAVANERLTKERDECEALADRRLKERDDAHAAATAAEEDCAKWKAYAEDLETQLEEAREEKDGALKLVDEANQVATQWKEKAEELEQQRGVPVDTPADHPTAARLAADLRRAQVDKELAERRAARAREDRDGLRRAAAEARRAAADAAAKADAVEREATRLRDENARLAKELDDAQLRLAEAEEEVENASNKAEVYSSLLGSLPAGDRPADIQAGAGSTATRYMTALETTPQHRDEEEEGRAAGPNAVISTVALEALRRDHARAEQELREAGRKLRDEYTPNHHVLVRTLSAIVINRADAWTQQFEQAIRVVKTEAGVETARDIVTDAMERALADDQLAFGPAIPPRYPGGAVSPFRDYGDEQGGVSMTLPDQREQQQGQQHQRRGGEGVTFAATVGRTPPPAHLPAPTARHSPEALSQQDRRRLELLEQLAAQATQPPAPAQSVIIHNATLPTFSSKSVRSWLASAAGVLAQLTDAQATTAIQKAMGTEFLKCVDTYGHTPATKDEWIRAIRTVYPDEVPTLAQKRVRAMEKNPNESLENFIRRAITESRGTSWGEEQAVQELIAICYKPDVEYFNTPPVPTTRLELLEKARQRDRQQSVGRDPPGTSGKAKTANTGRAEGSPAAGKKPATTSATYAAATASGAPTNAADVAFGNAGNSSNGGARGKRGKQEDELAARLTRVEELLTRQFGGQQWSTSRGAARPAPPRNQPDQLCYHCHQPGHLLRECPSRKCFHCGRGGHIAAACPLKTQGRQQQTAPAGAVTDCQICGRADHSARQCPAFVHTAVPEGDTNAGPTAGN